MIAPEPASHSIHESQAKMCFFAHFDAEGRVDPHVLHHLKELHGLGFQIVFITTSRLATAELETLAPFVLETIQRENTGLDFASWAEAYRKYGAILQGELLLANDSVYGPIGDLYSAYKRLTAIEADFYGMVESLELARHLQSWWLLLTPAAHRSSAFRNIMALPFGAMTKREIIEQAEVGLTASLENAGFKGAALYSSRQSGPLGHEVPTNPSHLLWREVIRAGVPFLKVELLRDNPSLVPDVLAWRHIFSSKSPGLVSLVEGHLRRKSGCVLVNGYKVGRVHQLRGWFYGADRKLSQRGFRRLAGANLVLFRFALASFGFANRLRISVMERGHLLTDRGRESGATEKRKLK